MESDGKESVKGVHPESGALVVRYIMTVEDVIEGLNLHGRAQHAGALMRWIRPVLSILAIAAAVLVSVALQRIHVPSLLLGLFGVYQLFFRDKLMASLRRRQYGTHPSMGKEIEWRISEDGVEVRSELGESDLRWGGVVGAVVGEVGLLLYSTKQIFHHLPRRGVETPENWERLKVLVQKQSLKYKEITG